MKRRDFVDTTIKSAKENADTELEIVQCKENADTELEIVRCKDCRYYVENGLVDAVCTNWSSSTNRNSFCSFAVKIDKNEEDFARLNHGRRKKRKKRNCKHYMYHVTERPYLDSIIAKGEGLNRTAHRKRLGIYLCSNPSNWVDSFKEPAVIQVDLEGLNCFMSAFPENDEVIVWGDIPVERLTVVDPVDWKMGHQSQKIYLLIWNPLIKLKGEKKMKNVKRILYELMWIAIVLIVFPFEILLASIIAVFKKGRKWLTKRAKEGEIYIDIFTSQYVSDKLMKTYVSIASLIIKIDMWIVEINQALDEDVY